MQKYLEKALQLENCSQNELAKRMKIAPAYLSQMKRGAVGWSQEAIVKLAKLSNEKPEVLLAEYELSQPHSKQVKTMWERISKKATAAVSILGMPLLSISEYGANVLQYIYYVKFNESENRVNPTI